MFGAFLGISAFQLGYFGGLGRRIALALPAPPERTHDGTAILMAMILAGVSIALLALRAALSGGAHTLLEARTERQSEGVNIPLISEAFLVAVPSFLLLWTIGGTNRRLARMLSVIPACAVLLGSVPGGERRYLLPLLGGIYAFYHLRKGIQPNAIVATAASLCVVLLILAPVESVRSGELSFRAAVVDSIRDAPGTVEGLLESQSTSMLNALALEMQVVGEDKEIGYRWGQSILVETILQPIPRQILAIKPETIRTVLIEHFWDIEGGACTSMCPTFSSLGTFYADFGLLGVVIGALLLGGLVRSTWEFLQLYRNNAIAQVAYSAAFTLPLFLWWSNLGSAVVVLGIYVLPVLMIGWLSRVQPNSRRLVR
jgi:hypothetical protein